MANEEALVQEITRQVRQELMQSQKMALVLFTGATMGFDTVLEQVRRLGEEGFCFEVILTHSAAQIFDKDQIQEAIKPFQILQGVPDGAPEAYAACYPTILVPAMSVYTVAKVVSCAPESDVGRIILNSMMRGKNVVISTDGCCPDKEERIEKGYRMTPALKSSLRRNIKLLEAYGATLASAATFYETVMQAISSEVKIL